MEPGVDTRNTMTFDDVNTNRFEAGGTGKDSVPRIGKRPWQPYIGGVQLPADSGSKARSTEETDFARTAPSDFAGHHGTRLFVSKDSIHDECQSAHGSIYASTKSAASDKSNKSPVFGKSADATQIATKTTVETATTEATPSDAADASDSAKRSNADRSSANNPANSSVAATTTTTAMAIVKQAATGAKAIGRTARRTAASVKNTAAKAREAWHTFTNLKGVQFVIAFFRKAHAIWKKRMKFSYAFYAIVFFLLTSTEIIFLQWGMYSEPKYDKNAQIDGTTKILQSVNGQVTRFISQMWLEQKNVCLVSFIGLALIYLVLIFVTNRFWIATLIFGVAITAFGVANSVKVKLRNEPIIPADMTFVSGGDTGSIMSFVPKSSQSFVNGAINVVVWFAVIVCVLFVLDGRRKFIHCSWRHPFANVKNIVGNVFRILAAVLSVALLSSYAIGLGTPGSSTYSWAKENGYTPQLWDSLNDARINGPATTFLSLSKVKVMDKPASYSRKTMESLAAKYSAKAKIINQSRANELTDNTVILILSESFSDPTRVPGVTFSIDPMPNIRGIKSTTTSGLMLSPGYGGGTANIEYQALTGLNLANFNDSLIVPYQQLVPKQNNPYSFNQIWMEKYGKKASTAVHTFQQSMYLRNTDYKKFGFSHFYTLDSKVPLKHTNHIDRSPYVSDSEAYQNILDLLDKQKNLQSTQFLQLVTMQNHMPYGNYYDNNEFVSANTSEGLSDGELGNINTYTKGLNWTDQETADFLNQLDQMNRPITVIFYGDHLPGIYDTANKDKNNKTVLHETDYFIWSNSVSKSHGAKVAPTTSAYTSSNYFMALAADHMNAKVSPYLALLTSLQQEIPAMSRVIGSTGGIGQGKATYLDCNGNRINVNKLSSKAKKLLEEYKLVQYDQTTGKNYLKETGFTQVP